MRTESDSVHQPHAVSPNAVHVAHDLYWSHEQCCCGPAGHAVSSSHSTHLFVFLHHAQSKLPSVHRRQSFENESQSGHVP